MTVDAADLAKWFKARPHWMQEAARRLFKSGSVTETDMADYLALCKREAGIEVNGAESIACSPVSAGAFALATDKTALRLKSIAEVKGINALAPRKPLVFGSAPLTIIYGANGTGKTGYTRVLKHACGGKAVGPLHGDVFSTSPDGPSCTIAYTLGGEEKSVAWTPTIGVHPDLRRASLYDTESASVYVNKEHEVTYEPPLLGHFGTLVSICSQLDAMLATELALEVSARPLLPPDFVSTPSGAWYLAINDTTGPTDVTTHCTWDAPSEAAFSALAQRIAEPNPVDRAAALRKTMGHLAALAERLRAHGQEVSNETFLTLQSARADAAAKTQAATVDVAKVFNNPLLAGIGSSSWKLLWEQARAYSESAAYTTHPFPFTGDNARCVLCQQTLDQPAKDRFRTFESFVKGNLQTAAAEAEERLATLLEETRSGSALNDLEAQLDLAGVTEDAVRALVRAHCEALDLRRAGFPSAKELTDLPALPSHIMFEVLDAHAARYQEEALAFDEDAKGANRSDLEAQARDLRARKWLSEQLVAIQADIVRLKRVRLLERARSLTNTTALSSKKSSLSEVLVSDAFRQRFAEEVAQLGASRVRVTLEKTKVTKGQVQHQLKLTDNRSPVRVGEVLSEGEFRIVSLSAFLADVGMQGTETPFIFDDPISSLDQDYEELTATRLAKLSSERQVIVFTHRLSLLCTLQEAAEKAGRACNVISLQREPWGTGEPSGPPLPAQKPKTALNSLSGDRLTKARQVLADSGSTAYYVEAKALCSDIRITIERLIENDLLGDMVQRFRRQLKTMNKIKLLPKITLADCSLLDEMMTRYSFFEHSQPGESPVPLPTPDEFGEDLRKLKDWLLEFTDRTVPAA